jgi:predicted metal-dependent phosphoesterase TrpH
MKVDLHIHSNWSDGSISVKQIVSLAKTLGIGAISITDHDTMAGQKEAVEEGKKQEVLVIPGVEISAFNPETGRKTHILGFNVKDMDGLNSGCRPYLEARYAKNLESVDIITKAGYPVNREIIQEYAALDGIV